MYIALSDLGPLAVSLAVVFCGEAERDGRPCSSAMLMESMANATGVDSHSDAHLLSLAAAVLRLCACSSV